MILYENMKAIVSSLDKDTDFFDIVTRILQGDILAPYLFKIYQNDVLRTSVYLIKENGFTLKKKKTRTRRYDAETITDAVYADYLVLPANTPAQAKSLQHCQEEAEGGISLNAKAKKELICFKQERVISTLSGQPLKLADQFIYLGSNISPTESYIKISQVKRCNANDRSSIQWKSVV